MNHYTDVITLYITSTSLSPKLLNELKNDTRSLEVKLNKESAPQLGDDLINLNEKDYR